MDEKYDVVVVGGGAAGLSGAVALARSRRSVLVIDSGEPRNAPAGHVHNYLGRESTPPAELLAAGRAELAGYGGEVVNGTVTSVSRSADCESADGRVDGSQVDGVRIDDGRANGDRANDDRANDDRANGNRVDSGRVDGGRVDGDRANDGRVDDGRANDERVDGGFAIELADGRAVRARRVLVATGLKDELPEVAGLERRWGRDVLHCPYCHGWEARDRAVGVLATSPMSLHQAQMWRQLSSDVVVFRHTAAEFGAEQRTELAARGIRVVEGVVTGLEIEDDQLTGLRLDSGEVVPREVLVVAPRFIARAEALAPLGLVPERVEMNGYLLGTSVPVGEAGATTVPGVWLAGNVVDMRAQVSVSASAGLTAGAAINADLINEEVAEAVRRSGEPFSHRTERAVAAGVGGRRQHEASAEHGKPPIDQESWEARYLSRPEIWSGQPNAQLVAEAAGLIPGRALEAGCGEGGDALWLAQQGWQVTAVDFSATAVERGRAQAERLGVGDRIEWVVTDLTTWVPDRKFDLVTTHFLHIPATDRVPLFTRLADSVAPRGTLLVVGHHPADVASAAGRPDMTDLLFTAEEVAETLDGSWDSAVPDARERTTVGPEGQEVSIRDTVLVARRR
ncbi:hypothetical protein GCM10022222_26980 [Amycolatopsis ultiminotia]|uniref:Thioredoxin reductase n=1 Tax=Amycolatopsis ultiminotia TaxID=543629 RepID=A0ABP6VXB7_9PSEU